LDLKAQENPLFSTLCLDVILLQARVDALEECMELTLNLLKIKVILRILIIVQVFLLLILKV
jgi:hypothetical protein